MLKNIFAMVLAGIMFTGTVSVSADGFADKFTDVDKMSPYYDSISYTCDTGIFSGTSDTEFSPNTELTRGMFVTLLGRVYTNLYGSVGVTENETVESCFEDVRPNDYYAPFVYWAWKNKIVSGYNDRLFAPNDFVTKEQAAMILFRFAEYANENVQDAEETNILSYDDYNDISKYAITPIQWSLGKGFIDDNGYLLEPKHKLTRAETAKILYSYMSWWFNNRTDREVTAE